MNARSRLRENLRWLNPVKAGLLLIVITGCGSKPSEQHDANELKSKGNITPPLQNGSNKKNESPTTKTTESIRAHGSMVQSTTGLRPSSSTTTSPDSGLPPEASSTASSTSSGDSLGDAPTANDTESKQTKAKSKKATDDFALIRNPNTPDPQAIEALDRLLRSGKKTKLLSQAALQRGRRLLNEPSRAEALFIWAQAADKRSPDASFELAKLSANRGEIPKVKIHLREVAKRGGKKLLRTLEYDPTFALVSDDSEVQRLWRN